MIRAFTRPSIYYLNLKTNSSFKGMQGIPPEQALKAIDTFKGQSGAPVHFHRESSGLIWGQGPKQVDALRAHAPAKEQVCHLHCRETRWRRLG